MKKTNNVSLSKEEIEEILNALRLSISESQEIDEETNLALHGKLSLILDMM